VNAAPEYSVQIHWTRPDLFVWRVTEAFCSRKNQGGVLLASVLMFLFIFAFEFGSLPPGFSIPEIMGIVLITFTIIGALLVTAELFSVWRSPNPHRFRPHTYTFTPEGVTINGDIYEVAIKWWYFRRVATNKRVCRFTQESGPDIGVPRYMFNDDPRWDEFCAFCREQHAKAKPPDYA
jgi:hypothetical protein